MRTLLLATVLLFGCGSEDEPPLDFQADPVRYVLWRMEACSVPAETIVRWRKAVPAAALKACVSTWSQCVYDVSASLDDCPILRMYLGVESTTAAAASRVVALHTCSKQCGYPL